MFSKNYFGNTVPSVSNGLDPDKGGILSGLICVLADCEGY